MSGRVPKARGFTLIEVLVSVFIVGMTLALFVTSSLLTRSADNSLQDSLALRIASDKLEELRLLGYDALPQSGAFSDARLSSLPSGSASLTVGTYNAGTKSATVTVSWVESATSTVSLTTLIGENGL